jgi:hypothetical protein
MSRYRNAVIVLFCITALSFVLAVANPFMGISEGKEGQGPPTVDVNIVNESPISTTVEGGTVNVGNLPIVQKVEGTVQVENLPVLEPVNASVSGDIPSTTEEGELFSDFETIYTVPEDRFLVIEYASARMGFGGRGEKVSWRIITRAGGQPASHYIGVVDNLDSDFGEDRKSGKVVKLYADPGTDVLVHAHRAGGSGGIPIVFSISGHLVPAQ